MVTLSPAPPNTRDRMLREARSLFAERGFYGVSIAQIAAELGLTKQALLHHFKTKGKLYGLVLEQIAQELAALTPPTADASPAKRLEDYLVAIVATTPEEIERSRLLMREILDNPTRAKSADNWYLKEFLQTLMAMLASVPGWESTNEAERLATIIQLVGAISYHAVSGPTFTGIYGRNAVKAMNASYEAQLRRLVEVALRRSNSSP